MTTTLVAAYDIQSGFCFATFRCVCEFIHIRSTCLHSMQWLSTATRSMALFAHKGLGEWFSVLNRHNTEAIYWLFHKMQTFMFSLALFCWRRECTNDERGRGTYRIRVKKLHKNTHVKSDWRSGTYIRLHKRNMLSSTFSHAHNVERKMNLFRNI